MKTPLITLATMLIAGTASAQDIGMDEQKRQMEQNQRAAIGGETPSTADTDLPPEAPASVQPTRQSNHVPIGTPLNTGNLGGSNRGDHIIDIYGNSREGRQGR